MSLKKIFGNLFHKPKQDNAVVIKDDEQAFIPYASEMFPVLKMQEEQLSKYKKIPLTHIAALGAAFSQLPQSARTITKSITRNIATNETLFIGINEKGVEGFLRKNQYGTVGNIMQVNAQGKQVIAGRLRFQEIPNLSITETSTTVLPFNPTLIVIAVALISIEQKLDGIQKNIEEVLQFLKQEKQSKQRGNLNMLTEIMEDYKLNCQNEQFCTSRINTVLSIKNKAYQDIDFYQNQINTELQKQKGFHGVKEAQNLLNAVEYQFAEYQLACYLYAFSSFLEVLLQKSFSAKDIDNISTKLIKIVQHYEMLYENCYSQVFNYQSSTIESKVVDTIGTASKKLGNAIASIPVIKDGLIDEFFINTGDNLSKHNQESIVQKLQSFTVLKNNRINPFIENLQSVDLLYNTENAMITDGTDLYILQPE